MIPFLLVLQHLGGRKKGTTHHIIEKVDRIANPLWCSSQSFRDWFRFDTSLKELYFPDFELTDCEPISTGDVRQHVYDTDTENTISTTQHRPALIITIKWFQCA